MSDEVQLLDGIATFLGGPYDAKARAYRQTPPVIAGIGSVRRAFPKRFPKADLFYGMAPGTRTGAMMTVQIDKGRKRRIATGSSGARNALERVEHDVELRVYCMSRTQRAEDAYDDARALRDAIITRLDSDPTLGGCCFQAGELPDGIDWSLGEPTTKAEITQTYLEIRFVAVELLNV